MSNGCQNPIIATFVVHSVIRPMGDDYPPPIGPCSLGAWFFSLRKTMHHFSPELLHACKQTLQKGIQSDEEFLHHVINQFGYRCKVTLLEHIHVDESVADRAKRNREMYTTIENRLRQSPRGAYYLIEKSHPARNTVFQVVFAYCNGDVSFGGTLDTETKIPSEEVIEKRILAFEIFECKKYCKQQLLLMSCRQAIRECGLKVGQVFDDVHLTSIGTPVTVTIKAVDFTHGNLTLYVKPKKGAGRPMDLPAYHFAVSANLQEAKQIYRQTAKNQPSFALAS